MYIRKVFWESCKIIRGLYFVETCVLVLNDASTRGIIKIIYHHHI